MISIFNIQLFPNSKPIKFCCYKQKLVTMGACKSKNQQPHELNSEVPVQEQGPNRVSRVSRISRISRVSRASVNQPVVQSMIQLENQPENQPKNQPRNQPNNPFYDPNSLRQNERNILAKYKFLSRYNDNFLGKCCQLQENSTGNIYVSKQFTYSKQDKMRQELIQFQIRKDKLTSQNVIQIKQLISTKVDGFFSQQYKIILIIDYPFLNFLREISNRTNKKIAFSHEQITNFIRSSVKGYTNIQQAGFRTDKVRLRNIFFGIKNRDSVIKVAQTNLITPLSNYEYIYQNGPDKKENKDIYLSPEEFQAWKNGQKQYVPHNKSGVFALGMCTLDLATADPSRQAYHFTDKMMDQGEIENRIEIAGKKYGPSLQRILKQMLEFDVHKRSSFQDLDQQLANLPKVQESKMHLSAVPNQRTSIINNDTSNFKSDKMFKSAVSRKQNLSSSRVYSSRIKKNEKEEDLVHVIEHYTNGNKYVGQKKREQKHGKGKYTFKDESYYQGDWVDNKISGIGNLYFSDGSQEYKGEWRNDQFNGWGTLYSHPDKNQSWRQYEGQFKNGLRQGRGKMLFDDGTVYDGQFRGGKICGRGRRINATGEVTEKYWDAKTPAYFNSQFN